ncbi:Gfo/Idh/MocA family protein [Butyrivibrio sp. AE3004]|uniref:Gfo/Idh/MocA family protein n=1 Tax=Butyrivibrio sp. AE3004 TaxID=1506994 RepID=UPI000493E0DA|nr:Gfo/Idh/MocA family oxidoreductase [Butyrivibrio sp. AE3004]
MNINKNIVKVMRFSQLYGIRRTIIKVAGRTRNTKLHFFFPRKKVPKNVSLIGCGQYGFATISYFLYKYKGSCFLECYDIDRENALSTADFWEYTMVDNWRDLLENPLCKYVYIASNHYTHTDYAIEAIKQGKVVYCEKPIAVNQEQLNRLVSTINKYDAKIYFGYNRPFSKAVEDLVPFIKNTHMPVSMNAFVAAHKLNKCHWYNNPQEGTRICGNMGHWIDLAMYFFECRGFVPNRYELSVTCADINDPDDNVTVSFMTEYKDLVTITLSSRAEPFEGINETINIQVGDLISKIDDFRYQTIWYQDKMKIKRYRPKDVGHAKSILQPYFINLRDNATVVYSTKLMLAIKDMVINREDKKVFYLK